MAKTSTVNIHVLPEIKEEVVVKPPNSFVFAFCRFITGVQKPDALIAQKRRFFIA